MPRSDPGSIQSHTHRLLKISAQRLQAWGITYASWARASGMAPSNLRRILRGQTNPTVATLDRLMDAAWVISRHRIAMRPVLEIDGVRVVPTIEEQVSSTCVDYD